MHSLEIVARKPLIYGLLLFGAISVSDVDAQGPPPMRRHTATKAKRISLVAASRNAPTRSQVSIVEDGMDRVITVNSIPEHKVGPFPNRGNPHRILERPAVYRVSLQPQPNATPSVLQMSGNFGIAVNGVLFDPGAAEFWYGNPRSGWQYEALGGAVPLGLDANYAHVQPDGKYHYHGLPTGLMKTLNFNRTQHSPIIGWAADGFPIYALTGYEVADDPTSAVRELLSAYRVKAGLRPGGGRGTAAEPGGKHDGAFVNDYEFVASIGDLDECNGRRCVTPDFPDGTYAYFLTEDWPNIPRMLRGDADPSFQKHGGPPGAGRNGGGPPHGPRGLGYGPPRRPPGPPPR